MRLYQCEIQV
uniref:Uncharacterized protein n=1 Tax=Anguilla anguilla TaxID=7936 RepID=A0A0E9PVF0_ANGAN